MSRRLVGPVLQFSRLPAGRVIYGVQSGRQRQRQKRIYRWASRRRLQYANWWIFGRVMSICPGPWAESRGLSLFLDWAAYGLGIGIVIGIWIWRGWERFTDKIVYLSVLVVKKIYNIKLYEKRRIRGKGFKNISFIWFIIPKFFFVKRIYIIFTFS